MSDDPNTQSLALQPDWSTVPVEVLIEGTMEPGHVSRFSRVPVTGEVVEISTASQPDVYDTYRVKTVVHFTNHDWGQRPAALIVVERLY